jgi:NSS family neurotransmitter:Na+ symporter
MAKKGQFSKIGLIAATVGSAIGLGNVWRFPAETQSNGGAAFLFLYIICILILGIPVMLAEFSLGRSGRGDSIRAFQHLTPGKKWWIFGAIAILASYLILIFYMVVAGWTLEYLWQSITNDLYAPIAGTNNLESTFTLKMQEYIFSNVTPIIATVVIIIANIAVLIGGVQKGIERLSNVLMPLLFIILIAICCKTLSLPKAGEGLAYFLNPDFSKITPSVFINALGQTFFSLSLGMGILLTYAAYYPDSTKLPRTSVIVSSLSLLVAVLMGFIIFPAIKSFGLDGQSLEGATLVFVTLPEVFAQLPGTQIWSILFFLLLLVAALTSTVSIAEVSVSFVSDHLKMSRTKACFLVLLPLLIFSPICSLSFGVLDNIKLFGLNIFNFLDTFSTNILLPVASIGLCLYVGWFAPRKLLPDQLSNFGSIQSHVTTIVTMVIRFVAPLLIAAILIYSFL